MERSSASDKSPTKKASGSLQRAVFGSHSTPAHRRRAERGPKIAFLAKDVAALREKLVARGARFAKVRQGEVYCLCDGRDPDGNPIQLSNR